MTDFEKWQREMDYTDAQAAQALGISLQAARNYRRGHRPDQTKAVQVPEIVQTRMADLLLGESA